MRDFKIYSLLLFSCSVIFSSAASWTAALPGFAVLHYLLDFAQTHVHWVSDTMHPSNPLSPSSPALNLSQHQGLSQWVSSSHEVDKVLELQLQHQSFQWILRIWFPLGLTGLISLLSKGLSRVFASTLIQNHQFFSTQPFLWSNSHLHIWLLEKP